MADVNVLNERLDDEVVLIAGGGPVGLLVGTALAYYGVKSIILERNESTTKWPKMDLTNARSMELLARLGLADDVRNIGVPSTTPYNVYMTSGLHNEKPITSWEFPSVNDLKDQSRQENDGSFASEPWQRISQALFEKFLKDRCDKNPLVDCRFGWRVDKTIETEKGVAVEATHVTSGSKTKFLTKYLVACDGASSRIRRDLEIPLDGGQFPGFALLVHFRSQQLEKLFKFGHFWHLFIFAEKGLHAAAISQDDNDTFTTHLLLPLDADHASIDSHDAVYRSLGGMGDPYKVEIDEILGIGDAFDIGWKLAAVIKKKAGPAILDSYEEERRPIAFNCVQRSGVHMETHRIPTDILVENPRLLEEDSPQGLALRQRIHQHYHDHNNENTDIGIEMDHRHQSTIYPFPNAADGEQPSWEPTHYTPSTFVGSRAPHVFLSDGSSIFDHYGPYWTLIEFQNHSTPGEHPGTLLDAAQEFQMPIRHVVFKNEERASKIWKCPYVLVRPDGHVAWRGHSVPEFEEARRVVKIIFGLQKTFPKTSNGTKTAMTQPFAATTKMEIQVHEYQLQHMGDMQM